MSQYKFFRTHDQDFINNSDIQVEDRKEGARKPPEGNDQPIPSLGKGISFSTSGIHLVLGNY
jgi:hypothetical protein